MASSQGCHQQHVPFVCGQKSCVSCEHMYIIVEDHWSIGVLGIFCKWFGFRRVISQAGAEDLTGVLFIKGGSKGLLVV